MRPVAWPLIRSSMFAGRNAVSLSSFGGEGLQFGLSADWDGSQPGGLAEGSRWSFGERGGATTGKLVLCSRTQEGCQTRPPCRCSRLVRKDTNTTPGICSEDCHFTLTRSRFKREREATEKMVRHTRGSHPKAEGRRPKQIRTALGVGFRSSDFGTRPSGFGIRHSGNCKLA